MSESLKMTDEVIALLNIVTPMDVEALGTFGSALQAVVDAEIAKVLRDLARAVRKAADRAESEDGGKLQRWDSYVEVEDMLDLLAKTYDPANGGER